MQKQRSEIDFLTTCDGSNLDANLKKSKSLINSLNAELLEKESLLKSFYKNERFFFYFKRRKFIKIYIFSKKRKEKNEKKIREIENTKDKKPDIMNKKHQEQTNIISNLNKIIEDLKSENKKFSGIVEGIELEKESLKNQNTILKSMLSSYNPDLKFTPQPQNNEISKIQIFKNNENLFNEMFNVIRTEFKKFNTLDYKSFDRYFEIMEAEYQKIVKNNNDLKGKQQEFLDFLSDMQGCIEVFYYLIYKNLKF